MNRVAIVVLNWNGISDTLECLDSLQQQTYKNYSIIVVDNGSKDGSVAKLKSYDADHANTTVLYNKTNQGFAGGVNTGIQYALDHDFEGVALFNNDATADKDWLKELVKSMKGDIGITTGLLLHRDGQTIDSTGDWYSIWGLPFPRNRGDAADKAPKDEFVFSGSGGASLYSLGMLSEIGFFDEDFFAYYEDVDVSFRAQLAGYKVYYTPKAIAYHKQGATSAKVPGFTVYQTMKNLPLLFAKDVPNGLRVKIGGRFYFAYLMIVLNAIKKGSGKMALKGVKDSWRLRPRAWRARRHIQARRRVSDDYIKGLLWIALPPDQTGLRKLRKFLADKIKFGLVGVINTLIDFSILFILISFGWPVIISNTISTSAGLSFSFFANRRFTFRAHGNKITSSQISKFLIITLFGLWVLQPIVIWVVGLIISPLHFGGDWNLFVGKIFATMVSLVWNYLLYRSFVFRSEK